MDRFWDKVDTTGDCWEWLAGKCDGRYGTFFLNGRDQKAHRVAWKLTYGFMPRLCVLHRCDNPGCVNPDHLFLGTNADNIADRVAKGRSGAPPAVGAQNNQAKLTDSKVMAMRALWRARKCQQRELAEKFGVTQSNVSMILKGARWGHLPV